MAASASDAAAARAAEDNSTMFIAIVSVVWGCAFLTASLRFYTRAVLVRSFGRDDVFMVLAVVRCPNFLTPPPSPWFAEPPDRKLGD